jgi:hypothetical protein
VLKIVAIIQQQHLDYVVRAPNATVLTEIIQKKPQCMLWYARGKSFMMVHYSFHTENRKFHIAVFGVTAVQSFKEIKNDCIFF